MNEAPEHNHPEVTVAQMPVSGCPRCVWLTEVGDRAGKQAADAVRAVSTVPGRLAGAIFGPVVSGKSATLPSHNHNSSDRVPGCPLCSILTEVEDKQSLPIGGESMYPTPDVDPQLDVPTDSLDANEWARRFADADSKYELDEDAIAAWFAAALQTGQENPTGTIEQL
jgi:hypothetical protein